MRGSPRGSGHLPDRRPARLHPGGAFATTALLGLLQITLETALYLGLAAGVARAGTWFQRSRVRARVEAVSGAVLVGLGLRVALDSR